MFLLGGDTAPQHIDIDFGTPISLGGTGLDATTELDAPAAVSYERQDGYSDYWAGKLGTPCNLASDCVSNSCVEHTCFCGEGCACEGISDCSNSRDACTSGVCVFGG